MKPDKKKKPYKGKEKPPNSVTETESSTPKTTQPPAQAAAAAPAASSTRIQDVAAASTATQPSQSVPPSGSQEGDNTASKKFSKRQLLSYGQQWERYAEPPPQPGDEPEQDDGVDFDKLLATPSSGEGHFQFKSERLLEPPPTGGLFALDLQQLSLSLQTIPFYQQLDLPKELFSEAEIDDMDRLASQNARLHTATHNPLPDLMKILTTPSSQKQVCEPVLPKTSKVSPPDIPEPTSSDDLPTPMTLDPPTPLSEPALPTTPSPQFEPPKQQRERRAKKPSPVQPTAAVPDISKLTIEPDLPDKVELPCIENPTVLNPAPEPSIENTVLSQAISDPNSKKPLETQTVQNPAVPAPREEKPSEDLEAWLDSVLDD